MQKPKNPTIGLLLELLGFLGFLGIGHFWAGKKLRGILLMFGYWAFIVVLPFFLLFSGSISNMPIDAMWVFILMWAADALLIPILSGVWLRNEIRQAQGFAILTRTPIALLILLIIANAEVIGWRVAEINPPKLVGKWGEFTSRFGELLAPDVVAQDQKQLQVPLPIVGVDKPPAQVKEATVQAPITTLIKKAGGNENPAAPGTTENVFNVTLTADASQVVAGQTLNITGKGFRPNTDGVIVWQSTGTNTSSQQIGTFKADGNGEFKVQAQVPNDKDRVTNAYNYPNSLYATQNWSFGNLYFSDTLGLVLGKILETIFIALMATSFAIVISLPISFLAARNLMPRNFIGTTIYTLARTVLNISRSIEALILAVIFAATVGLGPFAGVLSLTVYAIASLGKFYSEAIEAIDPGPLEAITATGANRLQVITYAVIPQFIPQFIGFTLYMWDRSVRASTIVGFVGGGGIGFLLVQYINLLQFHQAGTAIWAIAVVVIIMDWASARIRARVI